MVFWAVQITSKWFEFELTYHSIIIIATTACSTILLTWSSIKIISVNSMYTLITILLWSIFTGLAIWISSRLPFSQVSTRNSSPLALTTILSSLSSSTVIVTSWNSVPSKVFWAVQITSKWFELEFPYHSIVIIATTACSTILLTWTLIKIISVYSMYTIAIFSKDWKLRLKGIQSEGLLIH